MESKLRMTGLLVIAVLTGCSSVPERGAAATHYMSDDGRGAGEVLSKKIDLSDSSSVKSILYAHYQEWKGTRYELRGMSKSGTDCSGFVHVTFKSKLGLTLPRSSDLQAELGTNVARGELRAGDLVFFKTGRTLKHVGVYLEEGRFLHSSTSQGVIISHLNERYWKSAYWKAKRLES